MSDRTKAMAGPSNEMSEPARLFWELWQQDGPPDLPRFLERIGPLPPAQLAAVVCVDLRERWHRQVRRPAEEYLRTFPELQADADAALDVVYCEFLVRDELGEMPAVEEFSSRFPEHAAGFRLQIQLHEALGADICTARPDPDPVGALSTPPTPLPEMFGRYRIQGLLGRGGMGEVYRAHDTKLERDVALKVMRLQSEDRAQAERFQREARTAAALDHPSLCPIFDVGEIGGIPYLTMPCLRGETLAHRLTRERWLPPETAIQIAAQVARAVHVAHQAGISHRDLKPSNIMVDRAGRPIVMDFGLARRNYPDDPRLTSTGVVVGTPAYLAPERIHGEPAAPSHAGDVYSLGVMLYEMLTGQLPFRGTVGATLRKALTDDPESPANLRPDLDPRLTAVCLTALAKDPEARFTSMDDFAAALEDCLPKAVRATVAAGSPARRMWAQAAAAAVLGMALFALVVWVILANRGSAPDANRAADLFQAGSRWEGEYHFGGEIGINDGTVRVIVTDRMGRDFRGTYVSNPGNYGWHIVGTAQDNEVQWGFTAVLEGTTPEPDLVGKGSAGAKLKGNMLTGVFHDQRDKTWATMALQLKQEPVQKPQAK